MIERGELAKTSFQIIALVGEARSLRLEAIEAAKKGDHRRVHELIEEADIAFHQGHAAHAELIRREASGDPTAMTLMLAHAEDQLMSAEAFGILAEEFIDVYLRLEKLER